MVHLPLFSEGVLGPPENLTFKGHNSTHLTLVWKHPFAVKGHNSTRYELVLTTGSTTVRISVSTESYTLLRPIPSMVFEVNVIAWNPVGQGGTSTLNLLSSLENCTSLLG